jgi:hypothetical protein
MWSWLLFAHVLATEVSKDSVKPENEMIEGNMIKKSFIQSLRNERTLPFETLNLIEKYNGSILDGVEWVEMYFLLSE